MPRNGSGTYSLPAGNPVEPNTTIETEWANTTLEDVGNELTNSLSRTGEGGMLAPLRFDDGTDSVPGMAWLTETSSGFYREGTAEFWATVLAEPVLQFTDNGVLVPSGKTFTVQGTQINSGSLDVTGNFAVNTDKFTVAASSGNTVVAGTLGVTGAITATGGVSGNITTSSATITGGTINGTAIGGSTAAAGAFTTLSASGGITGDLTGNVTGNVSGNAGTVTNGVYTTGNQTIGGTKTFSSTISGSINGNAATVTNGVYTTGDQTIAGTKTFSSTITGSVSGNAGTVTNGVYTTGDQTIGGTKTFSSTIAGSINGNAATVTNGVYTSGSYANPAWITSLAASKVLPSYSTNALKFLRVNSGGTDVEWATEPSLGTVTSVDASGGTTGMSFSGGPVTTSGTLTLAGTLAVANGGTGSTSASAARTALGVAIGTDVPSPTGTGASGTWSIGVTGNAGTVTNGVYTTGSYSDPAWITGLAGSKITGNISGNAAGLSSTLAVGSGGTGQTTYTDGQLLIGNSTGNTLTKATLTAGSGITVTNGNGSITIASTAGGGSVTSVNVSGGTTGLTTSGGPVTGSGTITLAGTLGVANGGTGATSLTSGYLVKGNGTSAASASVVYDNGTGAAIGTNNPQDTLTLYGASGPNLGFRSTNYTYILDTVDSTGVFRIRRNDGVSADRLSIDSSGNMAVGGAETLTTTSANALAVGRQGATNPVLNVDASTASVVTGLNLKGAAAAGGMAVSVTSSGTNENLTIDAKGSGTVTLNGTATGGVTVSRALTYGGVTLSNSVTGTGSMVLSDSPTLTGTLTYRGSAITTASSGLIYGLTLSTAGSSGTFGIAVGVATDATNVATMALGSAYTKTTSAWSVGSGNGSLDTGTIANSTWYHAWLIQRSDTGVVDVLTSLSATAPTMPSNYDRKRRIGSMKTNASAQWIKFVQVGDTFLWDAPVTDNNGSPTIGPSNLTVTIPTGVNVTALLSGYYRYSINTYKVSIWSPLVSDTNTIETASTISTGNDPVMFNIQVLSNTSAQVRYSASDAVGTFRLLSYGWVDTRGRNG